MATKVLSIRVPADLAERYDRLAKETGRTMTCCMTEALAESVDQLEFEYKIVKKSKDWRAGRLETMTLAELKESLGLTD